MNRVKAIPQAESARRGGLNDLGNALRSLIDMDFLKRQGAPATATDTATLTAAQMTAGIIVATPTAAAAYTTLTGAQIEAALVAAGYQPENDDAFDLTIINVGATTNDITLTAAASGVTLVGSAVVRPVADAATEEGGQGTFRFRRTAADTYTAYRVA